MGGPEIRSRQQAAGLAQLSVGTKVTRNERVLLINPPSPFLIEERVFTPTGILYAAAQLEAHGFAVDVLDLARVSSAKDRHSAYDHLVASYEQEYLSQVRAVVGDYGVIGVSATTPQYKFAAKILRETKTVNPDAKTVLGGAHATMVSGLRRRMIAHLIEEDSSLRDDGRCLEERLHAFDPNFRSVGMFDHVISGDAGGVFAALTNGSPRWITAPRLGRSIDDVPLPARHKIDLLSYKYTLFNPTTGDHVPTTNVMSQWGCPFPCNFCSGRDEDFYRTVRVRSVGAVIDELDAIHERYGIRGFMFFDDEINVIPVRFLQLLDALGERHRSRGYVYRGFIKSEIIVNKHPDTFKRMVDAGFVEACTGVESGSSDILTRVIRKNTTPELNLACAELAHSAGISFKAFTMIGHPYEREEDAMATRDWILNARPSGFDISVHQPYPGAPVYDFAVKDPATGLFFLTKNEVELAPQRIFTRGSRIEDAVFFFEKRDYADHDVDTFYKGRPGTYVSNVWTPWLSRERIVELRDFIEEDARHRLGATSVSGLSFDAPMGQAGTALHGRS